MATWELVRDLEFRKGMATTSVEENAVHASTYSILLAPAYSMIVTEDDHSYAKPLLGKSLLYQIRYAEESYAAAHPETKQSDPYCTA